MIENVDVSGRSSGFAVRFAGVFDRGGSKLVANVEAPSPCAAETSLDNLRTVYVRASPVGRQLLAFIRFRFRFPPLVRLPAVCLVRLLRQTKESRPNLGMPSIGRRIIHMSSITVLYHSRVRLRDLLLLQLFTVDEGLLRVSEYQFYARGACSMTYGFTVDDRILFLLRFCL